MNLFFSTAVEIRKTPIFTASNYLFIFELKRNFTPYIYILLFCSFFQNAFAQNFELQFIALDSLEHTVLKQFDTEHTIQNEEEQKNKITAVVKQLQKSGFINTTIDSIQTTENKTLAFVSLHQQFEQLRIYYDIKKLDLSDIQNLYDTITTEYFEIPLKDLELVMNTLLLQFVKKGKSFTNLYLSDFTQTQNGLSAKLNLNISTTRYIDEVIVNGYEEFPKSFIKHYLQIKEGDVFNEDQLNKASQAINTLPFANELKAPEVLFTNDSTSVYLYMKKLKSNRFDGLIGFSTNEEGKLEFNGYLDLQLQNVLNKGELLAIQWKSNADDRKTFDLELQTPYLFGSPLSPSVYFNIYKQDSTFLNIKTHINLKYDLNQNNALSAHYRSESSTDLREEITSEGIEEFKSSYFGFSYSHRQLDSQFRNQYKLYINLIGYWGNRTKTIENLNTSQQRYELKAHFNWQLNNRNYLFIQTSNGILFSDDILENELYRIGGANSIRGFNEESIFASTYTVLNLEYRYLTANQSYLYTITDFAYVENEVINYASQLFSFGVGYSYQTKSGLVDLSYAMGKTEELPFDFQNAKFHIRLIQFF